MEKKQLFSNEFYHKLFGRVLSAQTLHARFLSATQPYLSYYFTGQNVAFLKEKVFPEFDILNILSSYKPKAYNPLQYLVKQFMDEVATSTISTSVKPYPVSGKEPYESYADSLEDYLIEKHRISKRSSFLRSIVFELLMHGYFGLYSDGKKYWFLTPYDFFLGDTKLINTQAQPFIVRRTTVSKGFLNKLNIDTQKETPTSYSPIVDENILNDLQRYYVYDVWVKDLDLNVAFTQAGTKIYSQRFPYPKRYPFFIGRLSELTDSFYPIPVMGLLVEALKEYRKEQDNIVSSASSIGNPILTYDADAGIDVNKLLAALKYGYKHIIVGKNREGDINFKSPAQLPAYAQKLPQEVEDKMSRYLGINEAFFGKTGSARERGAISRLYRASFRSLNAVAHVIENTFTDLDSYLIDYLQKHPLKSADDYKYLNIEELFSPKGIYFIPKETIKAFSLEDSYENKMLTITKWRTKLIPQELALSELGYNQPRKILKRIKNEVIESLKLKNSLEKPPEPFNLTSEITKRLNGKLKYAYWINPLTDDKALVKISKDDKSTAALLLNDLSDKVLIQLTDVKKKATIHPIEEQKPTPTQQVPQAPSSTNLTPIVENRGRPSTQLPSVESLAKKTNAIKPQAEPTPTSTIEPNTFSEDDLQSYVKESRPIDKAHIKYYLGLPGYYIKEPHAKWIHEGKKLLIVKAKKLNVIGKSFILCGKKAYGVITFKKIIDKFDFDKLRKYHMVSPSERDRWWGNRPLYLYMFVYRPFETPLSYVKKSGLQDILPTVKITEGQLGLPQTGDLKPVIIKPEMVPPPNKPEKKAFQSNEVFSVARLKKILPESTYDVSYKVDGMRTFAWVVNGKAKLFSDSKKELPPNRVRPILDYLEKHFKHTVLLDGEVVMNGIARKDITGYIHGRFKPTPEELKSLRYKCWDILYVKDRSIAAMPFIKRSAVLDLYLPYSNSDTIVQRVHHVVVKLPGIPRAIKQVTSKEGVVIRDINASYWATHATYKMKWMYDVDAKVIGIEKTKVGLPIYYCALKDGTFIGKTYAQSEIKAKVGDVIRVNIEHISIRPDGSINWYAPRPKSFKNAKMVSGKGLLQVGIGGPDTLALAKEIYLASGGSEDKWDAWLPKHKEWTKTKLPEILKKIKNIS